MNSDETKREIDGLRERMAEMQRRLRERKRPLAVIFEGCHTAGKGAAISAFIRPLDPRGFSVNCFDPPVGDERRFPEMKRFFDVLPEYGRIAVFDSSWYGLEAARRVRGRCDENFCESCLDFERMLADDGYIICKIFLDITREEQKKRMHRLLAKKSTRWRVSTDNIFQNEHFEEFSKAYMDILEATDTPQAPWVRINAQSKAHLEREVMRTALSACEAALAPREESEEPPAEFTAQAPEIGRGGGRQMSREDYEAQAGELKKRLAELHGKIYAKGIPVIILFEGWDAAGKGGAIKRLTRAFDPRGCEVTPVSAPDAAERARHYLWRFWKKLPKSGHIAIFDRTWYGRVMVERIEGFCSRAEWQRAYREITEFERYLRRQGVVIVKFWLDITPEEQLARFESRRDDPQRSWKLTDEDWRNREKWPEYAAAVRQMIARTSTDDAPWTVVLANDKLSARIEVMRTAAQQMERALAAAKHRRAKKDKKGGGSDAAHE